MSSRARKRVSSIENAVHDEDSTPKSRRRSRKPSEKCQMNAELDVSLILEEAEKSEIRRSTRKRRETKYIDDFVYENRKQNEEEKDGIELGELCKFDEDENSIEVDHTNPNILWNDGDVRGSDLYGFKTPKKRQSVLQPCTPKSTKKTPGKTAKTPSHVRHNIRKEIKKAQEDSEGSDFSADESDYEPSGSSSDDDDVEENSSQSEEEEVPVKKAATKTPKKLVLPQTPFSRRRSTRKSNNPELVLQSDNYFSTHSAHSVTSNHTLDRLKNPRLPHDELFRMLDSLEISKSHEKSIKELHKDYHQQFPKWLLYLNDGFNILLYGLGSKKNLLEDFQKQYLNELSNNAVIVVNGFFPSLTIKDILDPITKDLLDMQATTANIHDTIDEIAVEMSKTDSHIFLIVHNIDGVMLRNEKAQSTLSRLGNIQNIHLLASIDHINTGLLWDNTKLANFNFLWWDTTTMLPYKYETAYENSLLVQNSGALELSSMRNVFLSLTSNGRGIYLLIVKNQMKNKGNAQFQGISFRDLYTNCREQFLVSSDVALKGQLTEFVDHKMVKMKRSPDGNEYLKIPIDHNLLLQFLEEHDKA